MDDQRSCPEDPQTLEVGDEAMDREHVIEAASTDELTIPVLDPTVTVDPQSARQTGPLVNPAQGINQG